VTISTIPAALSLRLGVTALEAAPVAAQPSRVRLKKK
jgi:hypothetical protein